MNMQLQQGGVDMSETHEYMTRLIIEKSDEILTYLQRAIQNDLSNISLVEEWGNFIDSLFVPLMNRRDVRQNLVNGTKDLMKRVWIRYLTSIEEACQGFPDTRDNKKILQTVEALSSDVQNIKMEIQRNSTQMGLSPTLHSSYPAEGIKDV